MSINEIIDSETSLIISTFSKMLDDLEIKKTLNGKDDFKKSYSMDFDTF